ncbi:pentapeptide repeat-containing protein, partial [Mycobacterium kansasii]
TNTGSYNPGHYNTGPANPGNYNTGLANTGNINTGLANTGTTNNGPLWRGDNQGQTGAYYAIHVPEIALNLTATIPVNVPISGSFTTTVYHGITIE